MEEADFRAGDLDIRYLETHEEEVLNPSPDESAVRAAAVAAALLEHERRQHRLSVRAERGERKAASGWKRRGGWRKA
jgi:acetyl-CoA carboxylase biotin carboxylase subunit